MLPLCEVGEGPCMFDRPRLRRSRDISSSRDSFDVQYTALCVMNFYGKCWKESLEEGEYTTCSQERRETILFYVCHIKPRVIWHWSGNRALILLYGWICVTSTYVYSVFLFAGGSPSRDTNVKVSTIYITCWFTCLSGSLPWFVSMFWPRQLSCHSSLSCKSIT